MIQTRALGAPPDHLCQVAALLEVTAQQLQQAHFDTFGAQSLYSLQVHDLALLAADAAGNDLFDAREVAATIPGFPRDNWADNWAQAKRMIEAPEFDLAPVAALDLIPAVVRVDAELTC